MQQGIKFLLAVIYISSCPMNGQDCQPSVSCSPYSSTGCPIRNPLVGNTCFNRIISCTRTHLGVRCRCAAGHDFDPSLFY